MKLFRNFEIKKAIVNRGSLCLSVPSGWEEFRGKKKDGFWYHYS